MGAMGSNILYKNVHAGLRQGEEPGPIVSYCAGQVACFCPVPVQLEQAIIVMCMFDSDLVWQ